MKLSKPVLFLALLIIAVAIFKISYLPLPFYWDEAWVYGPAVHAMYNHGLSLLPDAVPPELSRGHPLLFHFTAALWMTIFGKSVLALHVFALLVALLFLVVVFYFGKKVFTQQTGAVAALLIAVQSIYLAQSGLLLPELFLSLWIIVAAGFYLQEKYWWYALTASFALLTKETGITIIGSVILFDLIKRRKFDFRIVLLPLLPWLVFLILQKNYHGWFFFPEHIGYLNFSIAHIADIMENYFSLIFIYYGRNVILFTTLIALLVVLFRKKLKDTFPDAMSNKGLLLLFIFMVAFIVFGGINFYSDRYSIALLAPFLLCSSYILERCVQKKAVY
jgi:4-amino-4-deoxy-L-arabinose transferase-like glycosyltransferase